jgi:hypothetical protein
VQRTMRIAIRTPFRLLRGVELWVVDLDSRERVAVMIEDKITRTSSQLRLTASASAATKDAVLEAAVL